uniref:ADP/ATP translocase n=1 Tax=Rhabditophanes sp. KR3021 TaxID=114890 RepID=A0AC35UB94_9BILA
MAMRLIDTQSPDLTATEDYGGLVLARSMKFSKDFTAGAIAAVISKTIMAPVERVKLILQLQTAQVTINTHDRYKSMTDCFVRLPKEQGVISFWRGNMVNIYRATSQESLGFAFKDLFRKMVSEKNGNDVTHLKMTCQNLLAGGLAGVVTFAIIYPLDFARTRLAIDMGRKKNREFNGLYDCIKKIAKADGVGGLYRGLSPSLAYIFIYRGSYYGFFDSGKAIFGNKNKEFTFLNAFLLAQIVTLKASFISYPLDTIRRKIMLQSGKSERTYNNSWQCAKFILQREGLRGFYSGAWVNTIRGIGAALVLAMYNELEKYM